MKKAKKKKGEIKEENEKQELITKLENEKQKNMFLN